ncbi:Glycosyltransferase involved in cell wall bisynthesis [Hyunsoonleella jejuensis]|uniref:Glycosyltransferase involved in cell wall bisynthesis n=1 Tax=Hyunsoonleella jejuensis TaxID=419940 RepID=A0A1H9G7N7_9FLAO|nr:glycosyltransferase [Hyunsoonleella jejuensis]SEQ46033.1 Glycosyltransferase involved in cell wall bisynthesis [Hyunsoonleella jejuensis]
MELSIIIPIYNNEEQIKRCLTSLLNQDLKLSEYEIIVVDDGSTDLSQSIVKQYAKKYKNIHLYYQKNAGSGAARNAGIEFSKGDYIYFLDADDYIAKNVLKRLIELCKINRLEMLCFNTKEIGADHFMPNTTTQNIQDISLDVINGKECIARHNFRTEVWWYITKRTFLLESGLKFPHDRFVQDVNFTARLLLRAKRISKINFDVHRYVIVEDSASRNSDTVHMRKYIKDLITAVEEYDALIKGLKHSNFLHYEEVVKKLKRKQHMWTFSIFIKAFKCRLNVKELKNILLRLKEMNAYPITSEHGEIRTSKLYNKILIPIFNNRILLFLAVKGNSLFNFARLVA